MEKGIFIGPMIFVKARTVIKTDIFKVHPKTGVLPNDQSSNFDPYDGEKYIWKTKERQMNEVLYNLFDLSDALPFDDFFNPLRPDNPYGTWHLPVSGNLASNNGFTNLLDITPEQRKKIFIAEYNTYFNLLKEQGWEYDIHFGVLEYEN